MAYLVEFGPEGEAQRQWRLRLGSVYLLGRHASTCGIFLSHFSVSRKHATLRVLAGSQSSHSRLSLEVTELGGVNGTFVDGKKLRGARVCSADSGVELAFGECPHTYKFLSESLDLREVCRPRSVSASPSPRSSSPAVRSVEEKKPRETDDRKPREKDGGSQRKEHKNREAEGSRRRERDEDKPREKEDARHSEKDPCRHSDESKRSKTLKSSEKNDKASGSHLRRHSSKNEDSMDDKVEVSSAKPSVDSSAAAPAPSSKRPSRWAHRSPSPKESEGRYSSRSDADVGTKRRGFEPWDPSESIEKAKTDGGAELDEKLAQILCGIRAAKKKQEAERQALKLMQQNALVATQSSGLSVREKRKLLWGGKKKTDPQSEEKESAAEQMEAETSAHAEDGLPVDPHDPNRYAYSFNEDLSKKAKFLKLMGFKGTPTDLPVAPEAVVQEQPHLDKHFTETLNSNLEMQYLQGIRRKDGQIGRAHV